MSGKKIVQNKILFTEEKYKSIIYFFNIKNYNAFYKYFNNVFLHMYTIFLFCNIIIVDNIIMLHKFLLWIMQYSR